MLTAIACLIPVLLVALKAPADSYASLYGSGNQDLRFALVSYLGIVVPFVPFAAGFNAGVILSNTAFLILIAVGWRLYRKQSDRSGFELS